MQKEGLKILKQNFHSKFGEIDIIAEDIDTIHFIEVKATSKEYDALYRITTTKLQKIIKTIEYYYLKNEKDKDYQIDAIIINNGNLEWIKNID